MGVVKNVFNDGIIPFITICVGPVVCMVWMALWVAPKMIHFEGCLTMGDVMGTLYGKQGQVATGVVGFLFTLCAVSAQIMALAYVYEFLLGFKSHWAIGLGGLIAITYAAFGGMKAVTITDVLQFVVLVIVVPMITHVMMHEVGGIKALWSLQRKLQIADHPKLGYYTSLSLFLCVFSPSLLSPPFVARMLMARDKQQVTHMLFMGGTFILFFLLLITLVGLAAFVLFPTLAPDKILPHVVNVFFPAGLRGLCATGLIAVIMSTADSFLHAAGLSVTHDVIRPLRATQFQELRWVKYCTFGIGCAAILLTLKIHSVFDIIIYGMGIMGATITVPFVAGVLGLKTDPRSFKIALWGTIPVFIATNVWFGTAIQHWAYPVSLMVNVLLFLGTHVLQNRGLVVERRTGHQRLLGHPTWSSWTEWLPTPKKLIAYSNQKLSQYGYDSVLFGLFLSLNYMVPFFMHGYSNPTTYGWILAVKSISIFLCVGLLLKPYWPKKLLTYFPTYYHLTLLYCLPFVTTFLFLLEERNIEWVVNIALSILFLIVLVDWATFLGMSILGILLALGLYKLGIDTISMPMDLDTKYTLTYAIIFSTLIGLLFARRKQRRFDQLAKEKKALIVSDEENKETLLAVFKEKVRLLRLLKEAGIDKLPHITRLTKTLRTQEKEGRALTTLIQELDDTLTPMTVALERLEHRAMDFLQLKVAPITVSRLLVEVQERLRAQNCHGDIRFVNHTQHQELSCDPVRIGQLLANSIIALKRSNDDIQRPLLVGLEDTKLLYPIRSIGRDYVKQVPALCFMITNRTTLPTAEKQYTAQMNGGTLSIPETAQELVWHTHQRIIKAHYGYSNLLAGASKDTYLYVIPVHIHEVRPKDMDKPYMELGATLDRADDTYPGAQAQEKELLTAVQQQTTANIDLVKTAIEMIKWYHGAEKRKSGEPFYLHPLAVAQIVLNYNQDEATILGALLHDTVEDTPLLLENIETIFGQEVASIVDGVTHLESNQETFYKVNLSTHENILMLLGIEDSRILYVKLADRMHNMRTIEAKSYESQRKTAEETLQFFVPLAKQLDLQAVAEELKKRSVQVLQRDGS